MKSLACYVLTLCSTAITLGQSCGTWSSTTTPSPGATTNLLYDVTTTGPGEALAVGSSSDGVSAPQPLVVRWDGAAWFVTVLPSTSGLGTMPSVQGVGRAPTGGRTWVVGYVRTPYPTDQMPLIIPWESSSWGSPVTPVLRPQTVYPFAARGGFAYDVTALAENDVWVVGAAVGYGDAGATSVPLALHFDGSSWTDVPVPVSGNRHHELNCVSASLSDNVWAVGDWRSIGGAFQALIVRWDGSSWSHVPNPGEGDSGGDAEAVLALAPNNVWVSGSFYGGGVRLIHWNGSGWEIPSTGITGVVASFASTGPADIWAADATNATIHHFDGVSWSPSHSGGIPGSTYVLRGWGMDAYDGCGVWAVGGYSDGAVQYTLAERVERAACRADFNHDGSANSQDFFDFLSSFFGLAPSADFNSDGVVNSQDFFDFLAAFFGGC